ncbi:MAG: hypothetical protein ACFE9M_13645 [Promethearchaeota archaeon]
MVCQKNLRELVLIGEKKIAKLDHSVIVGSIISHTADIKISKK